MAETIIIRGVVLAVRPYKDYDSLVTILTEKSGLITFLARGSRRPKSKLAAGVQNFARIVFTGVLPKALGKLGYINTIQSVHLSRSLLEDIEVTAYMAYIADLIQGAFEEHEPLTRWFNQLVWALAKIDEQIDVQVIAQIFELQLLPSFGLYFNWQDDAIDHSTVGPFDFSERFGGIITKKHWTEDEHRLHLDDKVVFYLRQFSAIDLRQVKSVELSPLTKRGIQKTIDYLYERHVGFVPKTKRFIVDMQKWHLSAQNQLTKKE